MKFLIFFEENKKRGKKPKDFLTLNMLVEYLKTNFRIKEEKNILNLKDLIYFLLDKHKKGIGIVKEEFEEFKDLISNENSSKILSNDLIFISNSKNILERISDCRLYSIYVPSRESLENIKKLCNYLERIKEERNFEYIIRHIIRDLKVLYKNYKKKKYIEFSNSFSSLLNYLYSLVK